MSVLEATRRDLAAIGRRQKTLATGGLAASALALARTLDDSETAPAARAACAKTLAEILAQLREQAPPAQVRDRVDSLQRRAGAKLRAVK